MTPERTLWRSVLCTAALDAQKNINNGEARDALYHYNWSRRADCKSVCEYANIDWDCIKAGFKRIYQESKKKPELVI